MKKVILFDFDNTLVLSLKYWKQVIEYETALKYGVDENPEFALKRRGKSNKDTAKLFLTMHPTAKASFEEIVDFWYDYMADKYKNEIKYISGAEEFLKNLKQKGYKLVLATATGKKLLNKAFKTFKIDKYFDIIICEEEVGKSKKEPDIYYEIMKKLNVKAKDCLYFEDSLIAITTAKSIGIDCVAMINEMNKSNQQKFDEMCITTATEYSNELISKLAL